MLTIVCIKQGAMYGPEYVRNLHAAVEHYVTVPHDFLCLTDDPLDLRGIGNAPLPGNLAGWWAKLGLFKPGALPNGRILYLDLDTMILDDIDDIASYDGDFAILRDFYRPMGLGSAMMAWESGTHTEIWETWDDAGKPAIQGGDQAWLEMVGLSKPDIWQAMFPHQIVSYKTHCLDGIPPQARMIHFHGRPKPHEAPDWIQYRWENPSCAYGPGEPHGTIKETRQAL